MLNTEKAVSLIVTLQGSMEIKEVDLDYYRQENLKRPTKPNGDVEEFWQDHENKMFNYIVRKYAKNSLWLNRKYVLKKVVQKIHGK